MLHKPIIKQNLMDILDHLEFDVSGWHNTKGNPRSNPKYCRQWCFEDGDKILLAVWYEDIHTTKEETFLTKSFAKSKLNMKNINKRKVESFYNKLSAAAQSSRPVYVALCTGKDESKVKARELDSEQWEVRKTSNEEYKITRIC